MKTTSFYFIILIFFSQFVCGQKISCHCSGLINTDYTGVIEIYNKPDGTIIKSISQDTLHEDYLVFRIVKDSSRYFHLTLTYCITNDSTTGWVRKAKYISTTANNYSTPLVLYSNNSASSKIKYSIKDWSKNLRSNFFEILKCSDDWEYIKVIVDGKKYKGWLDPRRQCNNPYTTCN